MTVKKKVPSFICDDLAIQAKLPQVLIGNEAILRKRDLEELRGEALQMYTWFDRKAAGLMSPSLCLH